MSSGGEEARLLPARQRWFATTHWSVLLTAQEADASRAVPALEELCRTYWYPIYAFVRRKGHAVSEAEDLTQEFFNRLLSHNFPNGIQPEGGKFRSYLLTALQHFLANEWQSAQAGKRGGGQRPLSLHELDAEGRYRYEPEDPLTPETIFDRQWASVLLARVREQLREEYQTGGKAELYNQLQCCLTGADRLMPYSKLANQLGCSESAVKMAVHRLRRRYGELLRQEISQTVASPGHVEEEIRSLLAAL